MLNYLVAEIAGKQYQVYPEKNLTVPFLGEVKEYVCEKVLLKSEGDKLEVGQPFLKEKVVFEVVNNIRGPKIRVATYKAKANYRRVIGSKAKMSVVKLKHDAVKKI